MALHNLKPGYTLTVTAGREPVSVSGDASAILQPGFSRSFGPFLAERSFTVSDSATVTNAESGIINLGGLLMANAGAPVTAVAATANVNPTGNDNGLTFTAKSYGASGNGISISYLDPAANSQSLSVTVAGQAIIVSLATNGGGSITSTAAQVKAAIEAVQAAANLVTVTIMTSDSGTADDGSGVVTAMAPASLASGAGTGIGSALPGSICIDTTNADIYRNDGTQAAPVWVKVGDAA